MIVLAALVLGALTGYIQARRRKGGTLDKLQYAAVYAIVFMILGLFATIALEKLL